MKKIKLYIFVLLTTILLSSCFWEDDNEVTNAKKDLGIIEENINVVDENNNSGSVNLDDIGVFDNGKQTESIKKIVEIEELTDTVFLEFDDLDLNNLLNGQVEITGKVIGTVDKIKVYFSNNTSDYPDDEYTLQAFNSGDSTFLYRAFSRYETLDFGANEYIFEAFSGDENSKIKITINVEKEEDKEDVTDTIDLSIENLPVGEEFGNPTDLGNRKIVYSDLKGLEIEKITEDYFECEVDENGDYYVSKYLEKISGTYFWWNTCRPFGNKDGITYYVLRLDGNDYVYEKHIFLSNGIYGIYDLESGEDLVSDEDSVQEKNTKLKEKNDELKEKNLEYNNLDIIDSLFTKLTNN